MSLAASTSPVGVPANVVLIVDDDAAMLIMLELILAREGIRVVRAHDGKEALHCLKNVDLPDLILTDLNMAGMGGEEFLTRVKKDARTKKVPVIVISGVDDLEAKSTHLGACACVKKPYLMNSITALIKTHLTEAKRQAG